LKSSFASFIASQSVQASKMVNKCAKCNKTVYPVEEVKCLDKLWHKACFKCNECGMTLNMKNYKGFDKMPYCNAHVPKAKATIVADTPEMKRLASNTKIQSNVQYHAEFEANKSKFTAVTDDPESKRLAANQQTISNISYHGLVEQKEEQEKKRSVIDPNEAPSVPQVDRKASESATTRVEPPQPSPQPKSLPQEQPPQPRIQQQPQQQQQQRQPQPPQQHRAPTTYNEPVHKTSAGPPSHHPHPTQQQQHHHQLQQQQQAQLAYQQQQLLRQQQIQLQQQHQQQQRQQQQQQQSRQPQQYTSYHQQQLRQPQQQQQQHQRSMAGMQQSHQQQRYSQQSQQQAAYGAQRSMQQQHYTQQQQQQQAYASQQQQQQYRQQPAAAAPQHKTSLPKSAGECYQAIYDYDAQDDDEVSFRDGDLIINCVKIDDGWMCGTVHRTGQYGMLPANYVTTIRL
jgi:hypothetical protein